MIAIEMEMPRACADCNFAHAQGVSSYFWCDAISKCALLTERDRRQPWCPLIEVAAVAPVLPEQTISKKFS